MIVLAPPKDNGGGLRNLLNSWQQRLSFFPHETIDADRLGKEIPQDAGVEEIVIEVPVALGGLVDARFSPAFGSNATLEQVDEGTVDVGSCAPTPAFVEAR